MNREFSSGMWTGVFGPAGLPQPVLRRVSSELQASLQNAEMRAKLASIGTQATTPPRNSPP